MTNSNYSISEPEVETSYPGCEEHLMWECYINALKDAGASLSYPGSGAPSNDHLAELGLLALHPDLCL